MSTTVARRRVEREERAEPTPTTVARLRPNVLRALAESRRVDGDEYRAGETIAELVVALGVGVRACDLDRERVGRGAPADPIGRLTASQAATWWTVYRPWMRTWSRRPLRGGVSVARAIVWVVVDRVPIATVAEAVGLGEDATLDRLRVSLRDWLRLEERRAPAADRGRQGQKSARW